MNPFIIHGKSKSRNDYAVVIERGYDEFLIVSFGINELKMEFISPATLEKEYRFVRFLNEKESVEKALANLEWACFKKKKSRWSNFLENLLRRRGYEMRRI